MNLTTRHILCILALAITACTTPDAARNPTDDLITEKSVGPSMNSQAYEQAVEAGNKALEVGNWDLAIVSFNKAIKIKPSWDVYMGKAVAQAKKPDFNAAIVSMRAAMDNGGKTEFDCWFNLGNMYQNRGMYEEAIEAYRAALNLKGGPDFETLLNISSSYLFIERYQDAEETIAYLISLNPQDPRPHHNAALSLQMQQKYKEAVKGYERVHTLDSQFAQSYYNKADALGGLKKYAEGAAAFERYIQLDPQGPYVSRAKKRIELYRSLKNR